MLSCISSLWIFVTNSKVKYSQNHALNIKYDFSTKYQLQRFIDNFHLFTIILPVLWFKKERINNLYTISG